MRWDEPKGGGDLGSKDFMSLESKWWIYAPSHMLERTGVSYGLSPESGSR